MSFINKLFGKKPEPVVVEPEPVRKKRTHKAKPEEVELTPAQKRAQTRAANKKKAELEAAEKAAMTSMLLDKDNLTKAEATARGEPWVTVVGVELDPDNVGNGAFELDFNEIFIARLVKAGFKGKTDYDIVDQWFTEICRNVVQENYEQDQADPEKRATTKRKDLGDGRSEFS